MLCYRERLDFHYITFIWIFFFWSGTEPFEGTLVETTLAVYAQHRDFV